MKIIRSSKCSLKFLNSTKRKKLDEIFSEYTRVVNIFVDSFWEDCPHKMEIGVTIINPVDSWFGYRIRNTAAREAVDMVATSRKRDGKKAKKPIHKGKCMCLSSAIIDFQLSKSSNEFDAWLHLHSIGNKTIFDIPIKFHKHFNILNAKAKRLNYYVITKKNVQFAFEMETKPKYKNGKILGIDTGIKALASTSDGKQFGLDTEAHINRIKRCKHGSKGQRSARRALRQRMDETAKEIFNSNKRVKLVVVEKLKNLNYKSKVKRRLNKTMRRSIGSWAYRYWLDRVQRECEVRRSSFRSVPAYYTSQQCSACGFTDRKNRSKEKFLCRKCNHVDNADINAAKNILERFITGLYGAGFKPGQPISASL